MRVEFDGAKVRALRKARKESLEECAKALGISRVALSGLESGKSEPRFSTLARMLIHFDMPFEAICKYVPEA